MVQCGARSPNLKIILAVSILLKLCLTSSHSFLFFSSLTSKALNDVYLKWQRQSELLQDSDFGFQEPVMALRTVVLNILLEKENDSARRDGIKDILTKHLVELSRLARMAKNTQVIIVRLKSCI